MDAPTITRQCRQRPRPSMRPVLAALIAFVVLYAPLGVTALWWAYDPGAPQLLDSVNEAVSGAEYAGGPSSVTAVRADTYAEHRVVMAVHTVLGSAALVMGAVQWAFRARLGRRGHRRLGYAYFVTMSVSMAAAIAFLVVAPDPDFAGWTPFRLQLWLLALSTLGTAAFALAAVRRGDVAGHRAWMAMNMAFMMTAPLLRVCWTVLGPVLPDRTMLENLAAGSVLLAVAAPALGVLAAVRGGVGRPGRSPGCRRGRWLSTCVLGVGMLGAVTLAGAFRALPGAAEVPAYPWFHVIPAAAVLVGFLAAGQRTRQRCWWVLAGAAASIPWLVLAFWWLAASVLGEVDAAVGGLMLVPGFPLVGALAWLLAEDEGRRRAGLARGDRNTYLPT